MDIKENAITQLEQAGNSLINLLSSYNENTINHTPAESVWSAGQTAWHLIKSSRKITEILSIPGTKAGRAPDTHVPQLSAMMEDLSKKTKSADFLLPPDNTEFEGTMTAFQKSLGDLVNAAKETDLTIIPENILFPGIGAMTKMEFIYFAGFHIKRHTQQIRNLPFVLKEKAY